VEEPVEVRVRARRPGAEPVQFVWRGRLYLVRTVLAHWVEARTWWRLPASAGLSGGDAEREIWRVEAGHGREASLGVYDLAHDPAYGRAGDRAAGVADGPADGPAADPGRWTLTRTHD
jgi:hypothetical protein